MLVFCDIETRSVADLAQVGSARYIKDPSTQLLCLVTLQRDANGLRTWRAWAPNCPFPELDVPIEVTLGPRVPAWLRALEKEKWVGHNCFSFDGPALEHLYGLRPTWYDTTFAARASGLPGGLDRIGKALGQEGKDEAGKRIMRLLCKAEYKHGKALYTHGTAHMWAQLLRYNQRDVELTEQVYDECAGNEEAEVVAVDRAINQRGIAVDRPWLTDLLRLWADLEAAGGDRLAALTDGALTRDNARSVQKVKRWLETQGLRLDSLNRKQLERFYEDPEAVLGAASDVATRVVEVLKCRQAMTRAMKGKLETIQSTMDDDGRVRDWAIYYGAHTGRWTSRKVQLHNMSGRVVPRIQEIIDGPRTLEHVKSITSAFETDDVLAALTRPLFCASPGHLLGIVDYAGVEARGVAWLAGEQWLLDAFNDPARDPYSEFASTIFGRTCTKADKIERQVGKICVLGLGYGMSHKKLALTAKAAGTDLDALGLTAEGLVRQYRSRCSRITRMWREVGSQLEVAVRDGHGAACGGRVRMDRCGPHLHLTLPSGRKLVYRNCRTERGVAGWRVLLGAPLVEEDLIRYDVPKGYSVDLYGSKCVENIVQAFCRDLLCDALIKLERVMTPVMHVHDEIVCEIPREIAKLDLRLMARIMSTPPDWADSFPLRVEGHLAPRYVKAGSWPGCYEVDFINGRSIK